VTLRAYRRRDGSGKWAEFRTDQPEAVGILWADIKPTAKCVAMVILLKQHQFAADEGRPVPIAVDELVEMHLGGETAVWEALKTLEKAGMLQRTNRGGGKGRPASYAIVGDPAAWLDAITAVRAGLLDNADKGSPREGFGSPREGFGG